MKKMRGVSETLGELINFLRTKFFVQPIISLSAFFTAVALLGTTGTLKNAWFTTNAVNLNNF